MTLSQKINKWQESTTGLLVFAVVEVMLACLFGSLAIDTGSLLDYSLTVLLTIAALHNFFLFGQRVAHGHKK